MRASRAVVHVVPVLVVLLQKGLEVLLVLDGQPGDPIAGKPGAQASSSASVVSRVTSSTSRPPSAVPPQEEKTLCLSIGVLLTSS